MSGEGFIGSPAAAYLREFGLKVQEAFGHCPFLVGSALAGPSWRDVDVRLILPDEEFEQLIGKVTQPRYLNLRWNALCLAFSALGSHMTGLPIDFQIDQLSYANERYPRPRSSLGDTLALARADASG